MSLPEWTAYMSWWWRISGSPELQPKVTKALDKLMKASGVLTSNDWHRLRFAMDGASVRAARKRVRGGKARQICDSVIDLCDRLARGEGVTAKEWMAMRNASEEAAWEAVADGSRWTLEEHEAMESASAASGALPHWSQACAAWAASKEADADLLTRAHFKVWRAAIKSAKGG